MRPHSPSDILRLADIPALLVTHRTTIRYLTGLDMSSGVVLVLPRAYHFFVDGRYTEEAMRQAPSSVHVHAWSLLERALAKIEIAGVEAETMNLSQWKWWKKKNPNTKFVQTIGVIAEFRRTKDEEEIALFRRAQRMTRELLSRIPAHLRSGKSERELAWLLRVWAHELGADDLSFDPIVSFGSASAEPHHRPTARTLKKGHVVLVDTGVRYHGYCADQTMTFFTARPTDLQQRVLTAVTEARDAVIPMMKPGTTNHDIDAACRSVLKKHGFADFLPHAIGHGVGLDIHEGISLSSKAPLQALLPHEIVTVEPGVYLPGKFGIRLEQEVIITE
ncbi:MAG: Xaa-Pro peptidase family protein [Candidatus Peregrinibacteria bacterium]